MASEDVKTSESAVSTIVNLAEEAKLAREGVNVKAPSYAVLTICKSLVAGGVAGGVSRTAVAPLERLKILLQVQNPHSIKYNGTIQGLKYIWRTEGIRGLFKGNGTNCARIVPNSAVKFFSYEQAWEYCICIGSNQGMRLESLEEVAEEILEPVDRISDLPDAIIHQIMWFLPTKDVVKTSVLSKRFKTMWRSNLVLDFDDTYNIQWNSELGKKQFPNFIRDSIRRHRVLDLSLRKFRLHFSMYKATKQIDSAIRYGMTRKPQELDLGYSNFCCHGAFFYEPPSEIFIGGSSIRVLKLKGMKLDRFDITQFPLIEELSLIGCGGLNSIRVCSDVIKIIEIKQCLWLSSIEVLNSDNLISFSYHGIEFSNNTELNSCQIDIISCKFLETLEIKDSDHVTDKWVEEIMSNFKLMKKLILVRCQKLNKIEASHEQLEIFKLMGCVRLEEVKILAPNLTSFAYNGGIIQTSLTIDSSKLDAELNLYIGPGSARGFHRLRDLVACFGHCKSLTLNLGCDKVLLVTQDQKDDFLPPLFDLKNLKVKFSAPVKDYVALVDSLLWFAPLLETISIVEDYSEKFLKLKYNKAVVMGKTDLLCCHARLIKCWRHYLKNVVMENFDTFEKESMIKFFTTRATRLERISDTSIEDIS